MKYFAFFLLVSTIAYADLAEDVVNQAVREKWTFTFKVPTKLHAKGFVRKEGVRSHAAFAGVVPATNLPTHFDITARLTPVKTQGSCGACWAFAITAAIENFPFVKAPSPVDLSEQNMIDCDTVSSGCAGGDFDGFDFAEKTGIATEAAYPFVGGNGKCQSSIPAAAKVLSWQFVSTSESDEPSVEQIKTALYQSQAPVTVGIHAGMALESYDSGIIDGCGFFGGLNHMVDIVGWDDTDQDWIVRNSWGEEWGEKGYFRILREKGNGKKVPGNWIRSGFYYECVVLKSLRQKRAFSK